jgi:hypothetical protein
MSNESAVTEVTATPGEREGIYIQEYSTNTQLEIDLKKKVFLQGWMF